MRILLVEPPVSPFDIATGLGALPEPLALETVAAMVCPNHDVNILDLRIDSDLQKVLEDFDPHVVATGSVTANLHLAKEILRTSKSYNPEILTVIGGHHVTFLPQDANEHYIDVIVIGEGDETFSRIINALEMKQPMTDIPGLTLNLDGKQIHTATPQLLEMDTLPVPARHLVAKYRQKYFQRNYRPIVSINTSRGCPYRCEFCSLWKMNAGRYRTRSAELVVNEIEKFEENFVGFIDDNSLENIHRANRLADLFIARKIRKTLKFYARADTIGKNPDLIAKLADIGMKMVLVGFETVRQDKLEKWNKKTTIEMNIEAINILQKNRIDIVAYFVIDPQFDHSDFTALGKHVQTMNLSDPVFTILVPFPGTNLYEKTREQIVWPQYPIFDFFHTVYKTKLPLEEFYHQFAMLYKNAYMNKQDFLRGEKGTEAKLKIVTEMFRRINDLKNHHLNSQSDLSHFSKSRLA